MRFAIDSMLTPESGRSAVCPRGRLDNVGGAETFQTKCSVALAAAEDRVIVTENARDLAAVAAFPALLVLKAWGPQASPTTGPPDALDRCAMANTPPGKWALRLTAEFR